MFSFYWLVDTYGLPLDVVIHTLHEKGLMPDWIDFWDTSMKRGWRPSGTYQRLRTAVVDVYGPDWCFEWERRMKAYIARS